MREHVQTTGGRSYAAQLTRELVETCSFCQISIITANDFRKEAEAASKCRQRRLYHRGHWNTAKFASHG